MRSTYRTGSLTPRILHPLKLQIPSFPHDQPEQVLSNRKIYVFGELLALPSVTSVRQL